MVTEMSATKAAEFAATMWIGEEFRKTAQKLLYYALIKDEDCPDALEVLVGYLDSYAGDDVVLAMAEYALTRVQDDELREFFNSRRQLMLYRLGLLTHVSGQPPTVEPWRYPSEFILDQERYQEITRVTLAENSDYKPLFRAMVNLMGVLSGALRHKTLGTDLTVDKIDEYYHSDRFEETDEYEKFLTDDKFHADPIPSIPSSDS